MAAKHVTATEAARNFSDILNQVRYQSAEFDIVRGKEVVARLIPPQQGSGVRLDQLNALLLALPRLGDKEADVLGRDIERGLARMRTDGVEWD